VGEGIMVGGFLRMEKMRKIFLFAVEVEKTEINILQKEWRKSVLFYFLRQREKLFLNLINLLRRVATFT